MRTRAEIDIEYGIIARVYGDRVFKGSSLQNEIKALHDKMVQLSQEPAADEQRPKSVPTPTVPPQSDDQAAAKAAAALLAEGQK